MAKFSEAGFFKRGSVLNLTVDAKCNNSISILLRYYKVNFPLFSQYL